MKRYFSISITFFLFSALNALTFFLLGLISGNTDYAAIFSLTYPLQYVVTIMISFFASASNIRANKENNKNCVESGMIVGTIFAALVFVTIAIFVDKYITFMNMDASKYHNFTLMAVGQLFFGFITNLIAEKLYFENKDKKANLLTLGFIILNLISVVIASLITKNQIIVVLANLVSLFLYCSVFYIVNLKKFKFNFSIAKNFKYESFYIVNDIFMLIIYFFGYSMAFSFGLEYVLTLNFVNLITDPQWDAFVAIGKIAKIDISQSNYNYKKAVKNSAILTIFYISISIILFFCLFKIYNVVITIGLIFLGIQLADMIVHIFKANLQTFLQLEYSALKVTSINLFYKSIRTILSLVILSPFNTNIAQLVGGVLGLIILAALRFKYYKLNKDGVLVLKQNKIENNTA